MKKIFAFLLVITICLSFSSCDWHFKTVDNLMRPPNLSGDEKLLQEAFEKTVLEYSDVVMKTPVSGTYRSPYIINDIDNDNVNEAIVLYSVPVVDNYVNAAIFKYIDSEWINVSHIRGKSDDVYEVNFVDINGDGYNEILLSWQGINSNSEEFINDSLDFNRKHTLTVYSYDRDKTELVFSEVFTNIFTLDLNNNSSNEILVFKLNFTDTENRTTVRVLSFNNDYTIKDDNMVNLIGMLDIYNIVSDKVEYNNESFSRIYIDGATSENSIVTEILEINEKTLSVTTPLFNGNDSFHYQTLRDSNIHCSDIDGDGLVEIPTIEVFPYSQKLTKDNTETLNLVVWSEYDRNNFNVDFKCLLNTKFGFSFVISEEYIGRIAAIYDEENLNLTFYALDSDGSIKYALFSCRIFTVPGWENNNYNYEKFSENDSIIYGYLIFKEENREIIEEYLHENLFTLK